MDNIEIEDIHHHDFTSVTEWEVFIARIEVIIHDWNLTQNKAPPKLEDRDFANRKWEEKTDKLNFADVEFILKHFKLQQDEKESNDNYLEEEKDSKIQCHKDMLDTSNDFIRLNETHLEIALYYGIREFLVLIPAKGISILDETRIKILLSSLSIAVHNIHCEVPAFVQVLELWQKYYVGVAVGKGSRVQFNMVHLRKIPPHCKHLTGLLTLFKQKIGSSVSSRLEPALVSVRFYYSLKDWTNSTWTQEPPDFDFLQGETVGIAELGTLPFGATFDAVGEFHLYVTWPRISENTVVDSEAFSDLEPRSAPKWSLRVDMIPSPACLLGEYLSYFIQVCGCDKTLVDLLGSSVVYSDDSGQAMASVFNVLTEPKLPTISTVFSKATSKQRDKSGEGPITGDMILPMLLFLFPDADDRNKFPYPENLGSNVEDDLCRGVKTCPQDCLIWRLAIVSAHCAFNLGGFSAFAQIWHEFVLEIRFRWENNLLIPGISSGFQDSIRTCLFYQKLQMLNFCIERKNAREASARKPRSVDVDGPETESEEEDEEFFECNEEVSSEVDDEAASKSKYLLWNRPVGRLSKHPTLKLLRTGDPLYLPVTQDPGPKTEDQLEEDQQVMTQLGTDKYASEMRVRLMSASLLSDMESFKAANPGSVLEDFIRWYSPRDWIEEDTLDKWGQPNGHLSERMLIEDNPWSTLWQSAQPVPANRQKRLFDDTREAEKVLHYLTSKRVGQAAQLLLSILTQAAVLTLRQQKIDALPNLPDVTQSILHKLQFVTKAAHQSLKHYEEIMHDIEGIEALIAQVNSLQLKLGGNGDEREVTSFIIQLMRGKEVEVPGGPRGNIGSRITKMFCNAYKVANLISISEDNTDADREDIISMIFPEATSKEFILRAVAPRPSPSCVPLPQRLYACLERDSIRLAGAFSEDTVFL